MKAVLVATAGDAPRKHALRDLLQSLDELDIEIPVEIREPATQLDLFYTPMLSARESRKIKPVKTRSRNRSAVLNSSSTAVCR